MGSRHRKKHQPAQQQSKVPHKFSVDERVLCYEPDQKKARVLYDSKVLQAVERTDDKGKIRVEYKIHFFGWNSSWDRYVDEDCVLKDTDENRELQKELKAKADVLIQSNTRNKKKRKKTITEILKEATKSKSTKSSHGSKTEGDSGKSSSESDVSDQDSSDDEGGKEQVQIMLTDRMKTILEHDYYNVCTRQMLVKLPAKVSVVCVFEGYVKFLGFRELKRALCADSTTGPNQLPSAGSGAAAAKGVSATSCFSKTQSKPVCDNMGEKLAKLYRKVKQAQETVYGLKTLFDFTLFQLLLYELEDEQYTKIKDMQAMIPVINCSALVPKLAIPVPIPPVAGPSVSRDRELMPPPPPPKAGPDKSKGNKRSPVKVVEKIKSEIKGSEAEGTPNQTVAEPLKTLRRKPSATIKNEDSDGVEVKTAETKLKSERTETQNRTEVNKIEEKTEKSTRGKKLRIKVNDAGKDVIIKSEDKSSKIADDSAKTLESKTIEAKFLKTVEDIKKMKQLKSLSVSKVEPVQTVTSELDKTKPKEVNLDQIKKEDLKEEKEVAVKDKRVSTHEKSTSFDQEPKAGSSKQLIADEKARNKLAKSKSLEKQAKVGGLTASKSGENKTKTVNRVDKTAKDAEKLTKKSRCSETSTNSKLRALKKAEQKKLKMVSTEANVAKKTVKTQPNKPANVKAKIRIVEKTNGDKSTVAAKRVHTGEDPLRKAAREAEDKLKQAMRNVPKLVIRPRRRAVKGNNHKTIVASLQVPRIWLGRINAYMKELQSWRILPIDCYNKNHEPDPSMIYGLIHLLRFFMKLPEILNSMRIPRRKIRIVAHHVNQMIEHIHGCYDFSTIELYLPPKVPYEGNKTGHRASASGKDQLLQRPPAVAVRPDKRQHASQKPSTEVPARVSLSLPKVVDAPVVDAEEHKVNVKVNAESPDPEKQMSVAGPSVQRKGRKDKTTAVASKDVVVKGESKTFDLVVIKKEKLSPPPEEIPARREAPKKIETKARKLSPIAPMVRQVRKSAADAAFKNAHIFVSQQILTPRSSSASRKQRDAKGKPVSRKRPLPRDEPENVKKGRSSSSTEGTKSGAKPAEDIKKPPQKQSAPSPNSSKTPLKVEKPGSSLAGKQRRSSSFLEEGVKVSGQSRSRNLSGPERTNRSLVKDLGRRNSSPRASSPPKKLPSPRMTKSNSFNKESVGPSKTPHKSISPTTSIRLRSRSDERQLRSKGSLINALSLPMNATVPKPSSIGRSKEEKCPNRRVSSGNKVSDVSEGLVAIKKERDPSPIRSLRRNRK